MMDLDAMDTVAAGGFWSDLWDFITMKNYDRANNDMMINMRDLVTDA